MCQASLNLLPESVEWMNTLLGIVWGLINPDMFQGVADMLEDIMQASVPGIIENVRVAEINQGSNPLRILSLRALPDQHMGDMKKAIHEENKRTKDPQEAAADEEGGDYYNLEVSFAYHAKPSGKRASDKARNMHTCSWSSTSELRVSSACLYPYSSNFKDWLAPSVFVWP
jgi:hypothetical protein